MPQSHSFLSISIADVVVAVISAIALFISWRNYRAEKRTSELAARANGIAIEANSLAREALTIQDEQLKLTRTATEVNIEIWTVFGVDGLVAKESDAAPFHMGATLTVHVVNRGADVEISSYGLMAKEGRGPSLGATSPVLLAQRREHVWYVHDSAAYDLESYHTKSCSQADCIVVRTACGREFTHASDATRRFAQFCQELLDGKVPRVAKINIDYDTVHLERLSDRASS